MKASSASSTIDAGCRAPLFLLFLTERLDGAHHVTDAGFLAAGRARRTPPWRPRTEERKPAFDSKCTIFEGVLLGDVQALGDFRDLDQPAFGLGAIDEDPNGVARGFVEAHADPDRSAVIPAP